jgi:acetyl-CoA C-acetyltransferase/acetyl-CoA acyltransferase
MNEPVIIDAVRTPFGRRKGYLRESRPDNLLAHAIDGLIQRTGLPPDKVGDVVAGCVSQAGEQGANVGRLAVLLSGLPQTVPAVTLNRMCGSSQQAIHFTAQAIAAGDLDYAIGCGVESMTRVPMFLDVTLGQQDFRGFELLNPAVLARHPLIHQVESAERIADQWKLSREELDSYAKESHRRAHAAAEVERNKEILPTTGVDAEGAAITASRDEGVRASIDDARMKSMAPVFRARGEGVVTAANSSQIADGAAAMLIANRSVAEADGFRPRARFRARVATGSDPVMQLTGVIPATRMALAKSGLTIADIDWIEINEAFATVVLSWAREFSPDMDRVNPWGGAIAHGHPLGASGAALMAKMLAGLEASGGEFGLQVMCIGHGMATATIIQRIN